MQVTCRNCISGYSLKHGQNSWHRYDGIDRYQHPLRRNATYKESWNTVHVNHDCEWEVCEVFAPFPYVFISCSINSIIGSINCSCHLQNKFCLAIFSIWHPILSFPPVRKSIISMYFGIYWSYHIWSSSVAENLICFLLAKLCNAFPSSSCKLCLSFLIFKVNIVVV